MYRSAMKPQPHQKQHASLPRDMVDDAAHPTAMLQAHGAVSACMLCTRKVPLTFHHLIPRKMHRRPYFQKHYSKTQLELGVWLCLLCHKAIHRLYDEMTLAKQFNSLVSLAQDPSIMRHIEFAQKQRQR